MMEAAHLQVVRIAEFSWSRMEPAEGRFDFDWLDHAIRLAEKHHIMVVLGTPTAAPPRGSPKNTLKHFVWSRPASGSRTATARTVP